LSFQNEKKNIFILKFDTNRLFIVLPTSLLLGGKPLANLSPPSYVQNSVSAAFKIKNLFVKTGLNLISVAFKIETFVLQQEQPLPDCKEKTLLLPRRNGKPRSLTDETTTRKAVTVQPGVFKQKIWTDFSLDRPLPRENTFILCHVFRLKWCKTLKHYEER